MTCIVGIECNGVVYLGGDSAGVDTDTIAIHTRLDEKVFRNDDFVIGFTSSFRMGQILRYAFVPPEHNIKKDDMAYLVTDFMDVVRAVFRDKGFISRSDDESNTTSSEAGGTFLLGYRGKLYIVDEDFQVGRVHDGFMAVGCGDSLALGSLFTTRGEKDPLQRLQKALEAAAHFSAGVRAPFNFIGTKQKEYIKVKKTR